jgi:hypothetical protein
MALQDVSISDTDGNIIFPSISVNLKTLDKEGLHGSFVLGGDEIGKIKVLHPYHMTILSTGSNAGVMFEDITPPSNGEGFLVRFTVPK